MRTHPSRLAGLAALALLQACAYTTISSHRAPELREAGYRRILVAFPVRDLAAQQAAENAFAAASGDEETFVAGHTLLFPGREYSTRELGKILRDNEIEAVLLISVDEEGTTVSKSASTTNTRCSWVDSQGRCTQATSVTEGGGDVSKPWASYNARLIDVKLGKPVWVATSRSSGNALATSETLLASMARKTVNRLRADGVIP